MEFRFNPTQPRSSLWCKLPLCVRVFSPYKIVYSVLVILTNDDVTTVKDQATPIGKFLVDTHQPEKIK
jgi:hypothetical protein